ncbi:MAG: hypothetical protein M1561_07905 [Gammaproteobacteria bacterium]|nr:hypothetical protein [Gammaproteobacteria bacterium]
MATTRCNFVISSSRPGDVKSYDLEEYYVGNIKYDDDPKSLVFFVKNSTALIKFLLENSDITNITQCKTDLSCYCIELDDEAVQLLQANGIIVSEDAKLNFYVACNFGPDEASSHSLKAIANLIMARNRANQQSMQAQAQAEAVSKSLARVLHLQQPVNSSSEPVAAPAPEQKSAAASKSFTS